MALSSAVIMNEYEAAKQRLQAGRADIKDQVIVGVWEACLIAHSRANEMQKQLDMQRASNAQSAQAVADMTMRLASRPAGVAVH